MNKFVPGPYLDKFIATVRNLPKGEYSTQLQDSLVILKKITSKEPSGIWISAEKMLNSQICKVTIFEDGKTFSGESSNIPTAICLAIVNRLKEPLKGLKTFRQVYKKGLLETYLNYYNLSHEQVRDLLDYEQ